MNEQEIITKYIENIIKRTENFTEIEAIFINYYCKEDIKYIDINFIRNDNVDMIGEEIYLSNINNIVIRTVYIPSLNYNYGLNYNREIEAAKKILNGIIIKDRKDNYYTKFKKNIDLHKKNISLKTSQNIKIKKKSNNFKN